MKNKALVIQDNEQPSFDVSAFMDARNLQAEYCSSASSALSAIKSAHYQCVMVSMAMLREDPLEIISALRHAEDELKLPANQILILSDARQPSHAQMVELHISGQIRSHQLK
jgi:ActR/RegA family two-component response regulator